MTYLWIWMNDVAVEDREIPDPGSPTAVFFRYAKMPDFIKVLAWWGDDA